MLSGFPAAKTGCYSHSGRGLRDCGGPIVEDGGACSARGNNLRAISGNGGSE